MFARLLLNEVSIPGDSISNERLIEWLKQNLRHVVHGPADKALIAQVEDANHIVTLYLARPEATSLMR